MTRHTRRSHGQETDLVDGHDPAHQVEKKDRQKRRRRERSRSERERYKEREM